MNVNDRRNARRIYEKYYDIPEGHHIHHKISVKDGGTNDIDNLIAISAEEHYKIHYDNWEKYGKYSDLAACLLLEKNFLRLTKEERSKIASRAGKIGGRVQVEKRLGIHTDDKDKRREWASMGGKKGAFTQPKWQSIFGKRGGVKNKGFIWINDGIKSYKYTAKQQQLQNIDNYLENNTNMKKGRA